MVIRFLKSCLRPEKRIYMEQTGSCHRGEGRGHWMTEGEGTSQRTYMHGPWTQTAVWWLPERGRRALGGGGPRGINGGAIIV